MSSGALVLRAAVRVAVLGLLLVGLWCAVRGVLWLVLLSGVVPVWLP